MKTILVSIRVLIVMTVLTGVIYPLVVTGIAQIVFPDKANGSLIQRDQGPVGSVLVGQAFTSDRYFRPRPSAVGYNPLPSSGSNFGPTSTRLHDSVTARAARFGVSVDSVPSDLLTASASGLDPDISPEAALFQIDRVVEARNGSDSDRVRIRLLVQSHIEPPRFGLLGEAKVNVLQLNLGLDSLLP